MAKVEVTIKIDGKIVTRSDQRIDGTLRDIELAVEEMQRQASQAAVQALVNEAAGRPPFAPSKARRCVIAATPSAPSSGCSGR